MEFNEWVTKLVNNHQHPIVKYNVKKGKLYCPKNTDDEKKEVKERLESLKRILSSERVERRCARCRLNWLPDQLLAKVERFSGSKHSFMGYQNKDGKYVFPEEAMFLLETNRAEIFWNDLPMNIDQAISTLIANKETLNKYLVYRNIALRGCDIRRIEVLERMAMKFNRDIKENVKTNLDIIKNDNQLNIDTVENMQVKKMKINEDSDSSVRENAVDFSSIFINLQMTGPKINEHYIDKKYDYKFIIQSNNSNEDHNYSLHFIHNQELDSKIGFYKDENNLYSCTSKDSVITKFKSVRIPSLL